MRMREAGRVRGACPPQDVEAVGECKAGIEARIRCSTPSHHQPQTDYGSQALAQAPWEEAQARP